MTKLVLWDIDRTLIASNGVGRAAFQVAFEQVTGVPMREMADPSGQTEPVILSRTLRLHGLDESAVSFAEFARLEEAAYRERAGELRHLGEVLPGVPEALAAGAAAGFTQTVLTGNTRAGAEVKLAIFGLSDALRLDIGAYGDDDPVRSRLVPLACRRASQALGRAYQPADLVIVGDTVHDIAAGQANGVRVVAVATGESPADVLRAAGADAVFDDLRDTAAVCAAIGGR